MDVVPWFCPNSTFRTCAQNSKPQILGYSLQEPEAVGASVDSVLWLAPNSILVCLSSDPDTEIAHMAMLTWQVWDPETLGASPEGLTVQKAGFCSDLKDGTHAEQTPHMRAVVVPQWGRALAVHCSAADYHMKVFGKQLT